MQTTTTRGLAVIAVVIIVLTAGYGRAVPQEMQKIHFMYFAAAHTMSFFAASHYGLFQAEGLNVEMVQSRSGPEQISGVVSGRVEFTGQNLWSIAKTRKAGRRLLMVYPFTARPTLDLVVRNDVLRKVGVSRKDALQRRLSVLKGLRFGITATGGEGDVFTRRLLRLGGLDPEVDASIVPLGAPPNMISAFRTNQIDAFVLTPPNPNVLVDEGLGEILISYSRGDVPEFNSFVYQGIVTRSEYSEKNPKVVVAFIRAVMRADKLVRADKKKAIEAMEKFMPLKPSLLATAYDILLDASPRPADTRLSESDVKRQMTLMREMGMINFDPPPEEGDLWTNNYRDQAYAGLGN